MNIARIVIISALALVIVAAGSQKVRAGVTPLDTGFTYQGLFKSGGAPASGTYHLRFQLWNALLGGAQVGASVDLPAVVVNDGLFVVSLDFGSDVFDGSSRWLQVQVVTGGGAIVTTLSPRQPVAPTPYALQTRGIFVDDDQNVGIGTASPASKLHVVGDVWAHGVLESINPIDPTSVVFLGWGIDGSGTDVAKLRIGGGGPGATNGLDIRRTGEVSLMRLLHNGNVGIGTTAPNARLHVIGDVLSSASLRSLSPTLDSEVFLGWGADAFGNEMARIRIGGDGVGAYNGLDIQRVGNVSLMRITDDGYVGIGTTFPGARLTVDGEDDTAIFGYTTAQFGSAVNGSAVGPGRGVIAQTDSGIGLYGIAAASTGTNYAVYGQSSSVSGYDFFAGGSGINYGSFSSIRWKHNIELIDDPLDKLAELRGVYFDWDAEHGGHHDVGMIAEEVGAVLPEVVVYEENGIDANGMDYSKLTPLLVEALKALRAEKDAELASLVAKKNSQIAALAAQVDSLSVRLTALESVIQHYSKE